MGLRPKTIANSCASRQGFTLVEILIILIIISVLAVIVVAQFTSAADEARDSSIRMSLFRIRGQLGVYQAEHNGNYPDFATFVEQLTMASDVDGNTAPVGTPGFPFGPYLTKIPINPNTSGNTIGEGEIGTSDWYYDESLAEFHANDSVISFEY